MPRRSATRVAGAVRRRILTLLAVGVGAAVAATLAGRFTVSGQCGNAIACENANQGALPSEWDVSGSGDASIQGFATDISVAPGDTVHFKVDTTATAFSMAIYRLGYYGGTGARLIATVTPTVATSQGPCLSEPTTGLIDCGNWLESASWQVPVTAVSGIYFAKITRLVGGNEQGGGSHIVFVVRDDTGTSDLLFQTSDTTWQAYNSYGGNSLYTGGPGTNPGRAYKVSYNRPFVTRAGAENHDWVFYAEYPMVRWLEANGFNVSYATGVDTDRRGVSALQPHKVFLSVGHDEYWSAGQRANVEAARDAGVHLAFFSGNEIFWKTRWENSIDGSGTPYRTLVCYKETHAGVKIDPLANVWTGTWRDPRPINPEGGKPENAVTGTIFMVNDGATRDIEVPAAFGALRFWRNTSIASLQAGQTASLAANSLGYEWDADLDNGFRPPGLIPLSRTTDTNGAVLQDFGSSYGPGTVTHSLTLYRRPGLNGALVFGAGTVQWSWGLDSTHDVGNLSAPPADVRMQQATVNLFADMGAQPLTLQNGLTPATASTDTVPPTSLITSPQNGATLPVGNAVTITGTAGDTGGGVVAAVEVSVDDGATWRRASGTSSWSLVWTPSAPGSVTLRSRAFDDSGFVETPSSGVTVTISSGGGGGNCPCSIWSPANVPANPGVNDPSALELGVKFRSTVAGYITGIRYYKSSQNTGTHLAHLWTTAGAQLAAATFAGETNVGWQQVNFASPVAIAANTTYVASYYAPAGFYAGDNGFFASSVTNGPLTALADGSNGGNGVYQYGASAFPANTYQSSNYWVDVVFVTSVGPDTTPPTVQSTSPSNGASGVATSTVVTVTFNESMDPATLNTSTIELRDAANNPVSSSVAPSGGGLTATITPSSGLLNSTAYSVLVKGGATDPRVKDAAGNALATNFTSTFTTAAAPPPPPDQGPGGPILVVASSSNPFTRYYAEILRTEGLNAFLVRDISLVTDTTLASYDVVILGQMALTSAQVTMFTDWVNGGGNLIAMRPDKQLAGLLGLADGGTTLAEAYLRIDTTTAPGAGIVGETMQFHGAADQYGVTGASVVATLYSNATTATTSPAVTLRTVGSGRAAAFTFDLARSVAQTRQGNPAWAGQERDGVSPIRSDDLFFGAASGDPQPNWIDLNKVAIPQADEQQRLVANLIGLMNFTRKPLPRFWYFPRGKKAVIVMTGDDHASGGTAGRFDTYLSYSPANCSAADWECVRSTSYIYPHTPISDAQVAAYQSNGFEVALHVLTGCADWTPSSLESDFSSQLADFANQLPSALAPRTNRTHCIAWSDYTSQAQVSLAHGIRFDTNYYYWPPQWLQDRPGFFTGSGMPMRFATMEGDLIDVYQATTQMTDESQQSYPMTPDTLLDRALGPEGYYGAFTANMHTDQGDITESDAIVGSALAREVPIVSARQMLQWLDGRNGSSFGNISWSGTTLNFTIAVGAGANRLTALVPATSQAGALTGLMRNGAAVTYTLETIKGVNYAIFESPAGNYQAVYGGGASAPTLSINGVTVTEGNAGTVNADFDVTLSVPSSQTVTVSYATANGTAAAGSDYTAVAPTTLTFDPGQTSKTVTVLVTGDTLVEANETFTVTLSGATNATLAQAIGTGTITNDDSATLSISDATVTESNSGTVNADFTVTLSAASSQTVTVSYATANGTATAGSDYTAVAPTTLTFDPGQTSKTVTVLVTGDTLVEPNETFTVTLSGATNAALAQATGTGTITNDDSAAISIGDLAVLEGNSGTTQAVVTLTLSAPSANTVQVTYATANGSAAAGTDYTAVTAGTATFNPNSTSTTITLLVTGDIVIEPNETFFVNLTSPVGATIADAQAIVTITSDDLPSLAINDVSVSEATASVTFTVTRTNTNGQAVAVDFATANGTATAGSDYTATAGTLSIPSNATSRTITVPILNDAFDEANETFVVNLTNPVNAKITDPQGLGTINDDDPLPALTINDVAVTEGSTGTQTAVFTVTLAGATARTASVAYSTANGSPAATAGSDYVAQSGTLTFAPGETTKTVSILVNGDVASELNETFYVNLSGASNVSIGDSRGVGTITDDDQPSISIDDVTQKEGKNAKNFAFTVRLSGPTSRTVTVSYATANGSATAGSDYTAKSGSLTFAAGATTQTVIISVSGDQTREPDETFFVNLSNAVNAAIADAQAVGTIQNDD